MAGGETRKNTHASGPSSSRTRDIELSSTVSGSNHSAPPTSNLPQWRPEELLSPTTTLTSEDGKQRSYLSSGPVGIVTMSMPEPNVEEEEEDAKCDDSSTDKDEYYVRPRLAGFLAVPRRSGAENPVLAVPDHWWPFVRPNGSLYYYNPAQRLVTSQDMRDPRLRELVETNACNIAKLALSNGIDIPSHWELSVEVEYENYQEVVCWNYISHEDGQYFQLRDKELVFAERSQYWDHVERYCMHYEEVPQFAESDFLSELGYGATERTLDNKGTTYRFTGPQTQALIGTYRELKEAQREGISITPAMIWLFSRTMKLVEETRMNSKYGTRDAAAARKPSLEDPTLKFRIIDFILGFMFSGTHNMYRRRLMKTTFNNVLYLPDFRELLHEMIIEWGDSNLLSTVFVAANVSFLAIDGITGIQRTFALASSLFAMISIAGGMHHIWHHRIRLDVEVDQAMIYLNRGIVLGKRGSVTALACFLSLPIASLLWSFYAFTGALTAFCVQSTDVSMPVLTFMLCVSCLSGLTTVSFFWNIWVGWRLSKMMEYADRADVGKTEKEEEREEGRVEKIVAYFGVRKRRARTGMGLA
ncbi:hypothetical protein EUX98_g8786 [Antrodiella citrinella]|uniref:WW domain-containing protein n=1 Tax=Antrodiella citrinella TaxID=2447956 RepID=A0A4S4M2M9_9APHY|nr:hypothetical protein EUX98_g8786 [Antrodiella citrinella]